MSPANAITSKTSPPKVSPCFIGKLRTRRFDFSKRPPSLELAKATGPQKGSELLWWEWVAKSFPSVASLPYGKRHIRYWEWMEALADGQPADNAFIAVWPRGGGKSSTTEMGVCRVAVKLSRRFVLYVCEKQDQANKHVQAIASLMERAGIERAVNQYGHSKGWKLDMLRTLNGFNVVALGLDAASRGVKLDEFRPDWIVLDDIDGLHDTPKTITKKKETITQTVLATGATFCAVSFVQNLITEDSVMAQIANGSADFLTQREPVSKEPALEDFKVKAQSQGPGLPNRHKIVSGNPTWEGQGVDECQRIIDRDGLAAFEREQQHEVAGAAGTFFDVSMLNYIDAHELPIGLRKARGRDLAATHGGGDWTSMPLCGMEGKLPDVKFYVIDTRRGQWSSDEVVEQISQTMDEDGLDVISLLPEDPGQAGIAQKNQLTKAFAPRKLKFIRRTGDKATYARGFQECMNKGNVFIVRADWNKPVVEVWRKFREDGAHDYDDDVDAASDAFNELAETKRVMTVA